MIASHLKRVINLSLDASILRSLMTGFAVPYLSGSVVLVLVSSEGLDRFLGLFQGRIGRSLTGFFRVTPPSALGKRIERE